MGGWRHILTHPGLRRLFLCTLMFNGLIMATEPLLAVLMLGRLGFAPWQYGLAFAIPCTAGLIGSRLSRRLVARFGGPRVLLAGGVLRAGWVAWLGFMRPGVAGLVLVIVVEFGLILCIGVSNPVLATYRLEQTPAHLVARTLSAWTVSTKAAIAVLTAPVGRAGQLHRSSRRDHGGRGAAPGHPAAATPAHVTLADRQQDGRSRVSRTRADTARRRTWSAALTGHGPPSSRELWLMKMADTAPRGLSRDCPRCGSTLTGVRRVRPTVLTEIVVRKREGHIDRRYRPAG